MQAVGRDGVRRKRARSTIGMGLTISYHEDEPIAAYLTLPHPFGEKSHRQRQLRHDIIVDFDRKGQPIGIEMLDPRHVTWTKLNQIMKRLKLPPLKREWVRPLRAA